MICCRMDGVDGKKRPRHQQEQNVISMWKSRRDRLWHGPQRTHSRKVRGRVERRALAFLGTWGMCSRVCLFQQRQTSIQCENAPRVQTSSGLHRSMSYLRSDAKARWKSSREGQEAHAHDMQTKSGGTRSGAARPDALRRAGRDCVWVRRKPSRAARGQHVHDRPLFAWPTISPLSRTPLHSVIFYSCSLRSRSLLCFSSRCYCCCVVTPSHLYQRIRAFPARVAS